MFTQRRIKTHFYSHFVCWDYTLKNISDSRLAGTLKRFNQVSPASSRLVFSVRSSTPLKMANNSVWRVDRTSPISPKAATLFHRLKTPSRTSVWKMTTMCGGTIFNVQIQTKVHLRKHSLVHCVLFRKKRSDSGTRADKANSIRNTTTQKKGDSWKGWQINVGSVSDGKPRKKHN